jgi:hypothetical protein
MFSRISTVVSCILHFYFLVTITVIGLASIIIGFVGLGMYVPTLINYNSYNKNICYIMDHEYDICTRKNDVSCYSLMWYVEYTVTNQTSDRYMFSTITKFYETPVQALKDLRIYEDKNNYTCYYHQILLRNVQWDQPSSPRPYLIMMIIGFTLAGISFTVIGLITIYRCRNR